MSILVANKVYSLHRPTLLLKQADWF